MIRTTVNFMFDGIQVRTSTKGNVFAEVFVRGIDENGDADFRQGTCMVFDEAVIKKLQTKKKDDFVTLELEIKEANIVGMGV